MMKKFLKQNLKKSWEFLIDSKKYIYFIIGIFFLFAIIGLFVPAPLIIEEKIMQFIQELIELTKGMNFFQLAWFIFSNNIKISILSILLGIIFGVIPVLFALSNGYMLGFVLLLSIKSEGILSLWRIFPHGIFELPAVFISLGLGLRLGTHLFFAKKKTNFKEIFYNSIKVFFFVILPLMIIAAIIESLLIFVS